MQSTSTSNEVKCLLLWEICLQDFSLRILERVFVGGIVNIRNDCQFSDLFFHTQIHSPWTQKKDTHSLKKALNSGTYMYSTMHCWLSITRCSHPTSSVCQFAVPTGQHCSENTHCLEGSYQVTLSDLWPWWWIMWLRATVSIPLQRSDYAGKKYTNRPAKSGVLQSFISVPWSKRGICIL